MPVGRVSQRSRRQERGKGLLCPIRWKLKDAQAGKRTLEEEG